MTPAPALLRLRLSPAELCVLLAAAALDPQPFIENSDLVTLNRTHLYQRLDAAREGLILRKLVTVQDDDSLGVDPAIQQLLVNAVQPQASFQLFHNQLKALPQRVFFSVGADLVVMHQVRGDLEHVLEPISGSNAILEKVLQISQPTASASQPQGAANYAVPNQVLAALAQTPPKPATELLPMLTGAGLPASEAEALLAAGLQPTRQTVFTALAVQGEQLGSGSTLWFADDQTAWLLSNFTEGGSVSVQAATADNVAQAIQTLVEQSVESRQ